MRNDLHQRDDGVAASSGALRGVFVCRTPILLQWGGCVCAVKPSLSLTQLGVTKSPSARVRRSFPYIKRSYNLNKTYIKRFV